MEIIRSEHQLDYYTSRLLDRYFGGLSMGVFDIETMGLNPSQAEVILAGVLEVSPEGKAFVTQFFAESKQDEPKLLTAVGQELEKFDCILTFNGKHFDLPFIAKRVQLLGLSPYQTGLSNLDLYLVLHGHSSLKQVTGSLKQKNVEAYMGLHPDRKDEITGADSIQLYEDFLTEPDPAVKTSLKEKILLHNHDDLLQLYRILPIIRQTDFHRAMSHLGFPVPAPSAGTAQESVSGRWPNMAVGHVRADSRGLTISGTYRIPYGGSGFSYMSYDSEHAPWTCRFTSDGQFEFQIPVQRHKSSCYLQLNRFFDDWSFLKKYPAHVNGFLVLTEDNTPNHLEINMFVQEFLRRFMEETECPAVL